MAAGSLPSSSIASSGTRSDAKSAQDLATQAWQFLRILGSLKITVVMFLAGVFILFVGTLAQDEKNLPEVKEEYFNSWLAVIPFSDFVPVTVFGERNIRGAFPFPGGATIGLILLFNLIAAKITRFHISAKGTRLFWGTIISAIGGLLTLAVIMTGHFSDGLQGSPPIPYDVVWRLVQATSVGITIALIASAFANRNQPNLIKVVLWSSAICMGVITLLALVGGQSYRIGDPGLRIMWQLLQSSVAGGVLLVGLMIVFGNRGGNVLIHIAVGLVMFGQFLFGDRQVEQRISLIEGQSTNVAFRTDEFELAVIDISGAEKDRVTVIADRLLKRYAGDPEKIITSKELPFDIKVKSLFPNSDLRRAGPVEPNEATQGIGKSWIAISKPPEGGVSSKPNISSAYVQILDKQSRADLGTYLISQFLNDQGSIFMNASPDELDTIEVGGKPYQLQLRYRREYKPYEMTLTDVRRINYSASDTPRDYSSYVTIRDPQTKTEQEGRIWMNNPVRYRGETFYQSQYSPVRLADGKMSEMTGLQVVENAGWLIPYVSCVLAFWGMLAHFGGTFLRFADRYDRLHLGDAPTATPVVNEKDSKKNRRASQTETATTSTASWKSLVSPVLAVLLVALFAYRGAVPKSPQPADHDWAALGAIPVLHEGRIKPFDTVARNTLQYLGSRSAVYMPNPEASAFSKSMGFGTKSIPATQWLMGVIAGDEWVDSAPVFRIDAKEVVDLFDLERHEGHRYSFKELQPGLPKLEQQMQKIRESEIPQEQLSFADKKLTEINQKLMVFNLLRFSYQTPQLPALGAEDSDREQFFQQIQRVMQISQQLESSNPPAMIPPNKAIDPQAEATNEATDTPSWQALYPAVVSALRDRIFSAASQGEKSFEPNPAILAFTDVLANSSQSGRDFNAAVKEYKSTIKDFPEVKKASAKSAYEAWFNKFNPTDLAKWLYVMTIFVCFFSFLVWNQPINRFVFWFLLAILIIHTFAIISRVYLTGRPPVVNLYSSAVFIGWACVIAGLAIESMFRLGIGNLVASITGAGSLMVAYGLDTGDTMHVLQAVLDTQFWLTTHVISVTLGYGATFLAGFLAIIAVIHRAYSRYDQTLPEKRSESSRSLQENLYRMTYGVVCFALFFSFIGTVLGGLWADDSWGRFWGWDPKENGALMIVLWNAALLHARWDRWVGPRGFALFAIGGNIITAWSWFGTNQLGIGLHSYGFTSGVLMLLAGFVASQLLLIIGGWLLTRTPNPTT